MTMQRNSKPRLCFVGPLIGRQPGYVTTQGQKLSDLFVQAGYSVTAVSEYRNPYARLLDTVTTLARKGRKIDLVIIEVYSGRAFAIADAATRVSRLHRRPVVMWLHGGALPEFVERFAAWADSVFRRASLVVAPSEYLAGLARRRGYRVRVIPNVIDLPAYPWRLRGKLTARLFWMRSFHPVWNPAMALRVLARVRRTHPDADLVMAGQDKGYEPEIRKLAQELGLDGSVRFAGFLDMESKAREGMRADIFINTNRIDNMPVAVVEACAMGLPVVTTNVGGIPDLLRDGHTGLLVPDDDDQAMSDAILRLMADPALAERLSVNGRELAQRSSWASLRGEWESAFAEVLA
jgi:glycosyltransferase involved in cell wall biosynthesis